MIYNQSMTLEKFETLLSKIKNCLNLYDNKYYCNKVFNLFLANGDRISYTIPESALAHLLGVNLTYLLSTSVLSVHSNKSIDILRELCNESNWYSLYTKVSSGIIDVKQLFSEHINTKLDIFESNIKPIIFDIEFICKIDRDKMHNAGVDFMDVDYLICTKDGNENFLVLGIVKKDKNYIARTSLMYETEDELLNGLGKVISNQEITFACRLNLNNVMEPDYKYKPIILSPDNKRDKVIGLKKYKNLFGAYVDTLDDFNFVLNQEKQQYAVLKKISESMHNGEIIDIDELSSFYYLSDIIRNIVEQYNNAFVGNNSTEDKKYSEVVNENRMLRQRIDDLNSQNSIITKENIEMMQQIESLSVDNKELTDIIDNVELVLSKRKK